MGKVQLSMTAAKQILKNSRRKTASKENDDDYVRKIDEACKKFDKKGTGYISEIDIISILGYVNLSCQHKKVSAICSHLPRNKQGKMRIDEFINLPILSEEAFDALDKNHDGFLTKGELKLANKDATMSDVQKVIDEYDFDKDGKLNMAEFNQYRSDSSEKSIDEKKLDDKDDSDEVVFVQLKESSN